MECPSLSPSPSLFFSLLPLASPPSLSPWISLHLQMWTTQAWGLNIGTVTQLRQDHLEGRGGQRGGREAEVLLLDVGWVHSFLHLLAGEGVCVWVLSLWISGEFCAAERGMGSLWLRCCCGLWCYEMLHGSLCNVNNPQDYPVSVGAIAWLTGWQNSEVYGLIHEHFSFIQGCGDISTSWNLCVGQDVRMFQSNMT